ncbi:MAG: transposase [Bacteroidales bacterium]|nr:transposase [Bacteroidales bacterium]
MENKGLEVYAYCIMPSHIHVIAKSSNEKNKLSEIMRDLKKFTSVQITRKMESEGFYVKELSVFKFYGLKSSRNINYKVWQDGFYPKEIFSNSIFKQKKNYIHNNPVDAGIVKSQTDYLYSSARDYEDIKGLIKVIIDW